MKAYLRCSLVLCLSVMISCEYEHLERNIPENTLLGSWRSQTVFFNGINSDRYYDFINEGSILIIKPDHTFNRNYVLGTWGLSSGKLRLEMATYGLDDRICKIIDYSENSFTIEFQTTIGQYCCGSDDFSEDQILTIREIYVRNPN